MKTRKLILIIADAVLLAICIIQGVLAGRDGVVNFNCSNDIDELVFELPAESFTLVKDGEDWFGGEKKFLVTKSYVDNYIEGISAIRALDKVASLANANAAERYELDEGHRITVTAKKGGKVLRTLLIGKDSSAGSQTYIAVDDKKDIYLASGNIRSTFNASLKSIRSKQVWQLDKASITGVTLRKADSTVALSKMGSGDDVVWNISPAEIQVDGAIAQNWFDSLANLTTPVWHEENEKLGGNKLVDAEIACGYKTVKLSLYEIPAEGDDGKVTYWAESSETPYVFELASYAADRFLKKAEDFAK
jgi:hypothetical protein